MPTAYFIGSALGAAMVLLSLLLAHFWFAPRLGWPVWLLPLVMTLALCGVGVVQILRLPAAARPLLLGLKGERAVATWLGELARLNYTVYHDLPSRTRPGANIDHVAVGPAGVFVIETKVRSRRTGDKVTYNGKQLRIAGHDCSDEILGQARACRDEVRHQIQAHGGGSVRVRAVVVFPEWWVNEWPGAEVWVLNPKGRLAAWIRQEERSMGRVPEGDIARANAVLDAWSRS